MTNLAHEVAFDPMAGRLRIAADCRRFAEAGNAILTLVSARTQARFTYRVRRSQDGQVLFVSLMNGPDNTSNYAYLGYVRQGVYFHGGQKSCAGRDTPSARAFDFFWRVISLNDLPSTLEVWHEGRCCRCARRLTVPSSVALGIGPECAERMGIAQMICEPLGEDQ